jgi:diaminohydroxyphosphoribosylaminopyrimidine deaminase / 5-amino-6-(5-phosphoribosylamino)uracil reductase
MPSHSIIHPPVNEMLSHAVYMHRCLQLADLGAGYTAPNPLVGAVLVHNGRIIGEGHHQQYGGPHAEVNCLLSVATADRLLIPFSTLYVSLEPCCHYGKTPPCTDLILREKIPNLVIGCRDPFPEVNGKGIEILKANGVKIEYPVLENLSMEKNRRFFMFHLQKRPYVILKWAQSANQMMAAKTGRQIRISNKFSDRLVHKWRSEEAGILIGTETALLDDPELTTRLWPGKNPVRIVLDRERRLPDSLKIFDEKIPSIILNGKIERQSANLLYKKIDGLRFDIPAVLSALHASHILSILVEGGAKLLQSFIEADIWDEIRIIANQEMEIGDGISSPKFRNAKLVHSEILGTDTISYYQKQKPGD